jgi:hypothetical protein
MRGRFSRCPALPYKTVERLATDRGVDIEQYGALAEPVALQRMFALSTNPDLAGTPERRSPRFLELGWD